MLEVGQKYKTKRGEEIKITKKTPTGVFIGEIEGHKNQRYTEDGKVIGWTFGHFLDIVLDEPEIETEKPNKWEELRKKQDLLKEKEKENEAKRELRALETPVEDGKEG